MAEYTYTGKDLSNKLIKGKITAKSRSDAFDLLKQNNIFIYKIDEISPLKQGSVRLKSKDLAEFSRQIGSMLGAGISITKAMAILKERAEAPRFLRLYEVLLETIEGGNTLSHAMEQLKGVFPWLMINMFRSGEISGRLDETALKMAEYYDKDHKLNTKIKGAMAYPIILLCLTVVVSVVLFTFVLPKFYTLFEGTKLPLITRIMLGISQILTHYWYLVLLGVLAIGLVFFFLFKEEKIVKAFQKMFLKIPVVGKLLSTIYTARFARTLSSLYTSGINMIDAVDVSAKIIGNRYVAGQFSQVMERIKEGNLLSVSMEKVDGIDKKLISAIYIGEETGKLDSMLISMANNYDYEAEAATTRLLTFLEPIMIVIMALIVGTIMAAVMLPMVSLYSNIGGGAI